MGSHQYQIANLLEKMTSNDKDFRFMATNDLMTELQKDSIKLDDESEKKVVRMVLKLLEDKNGEVQNLAVKCLGPLVNKVKENQVETIVDSLCANMISNTEQLRDISSIGLKTVISELPQTSNSLAPNVCQRITGKLSNAIEKEDVSVKLESLDILSDLLSRFGELLVPFHNTILKALVPQLSSPRQAVRKRTIVALSHLLTLSNTNAYNGVIEHLLNGMEDAQNPANVRTNIQCLAAICRQSGFRFYIHIDRAMTLLEQYSKQDDDELREFCLQACEAFIMRCPEAVRPHIPMILQLCLKYLTYDPNYNYEADDIESNIAMDTEDDEYDDSEEYSDDDDMSWKVRRAAAKCLESIIITRHDMLDDFYRDLSPSLIARFKEREENVKSDIFHAYIALLKNTRSVLEISQDPDSMEQMPSHLSILMEQIPLIIKATCPLMKEKSMKTRQDCFLLLRELLIAVPGALGPHLTNIVPGIHFSLNDKNSTSNMKIEALSFMSSLLQGHQPYVFASHIPVLVPLVVTAVFDPFYKIATEGLIVLQQLVQVIRPLGNNVASTNMFDITPVANQIYLATLQKLKTTDVDQEVKERAIACMGQIIANMGDVLQPQLDICLPIFLERLKNEITRLSCVKALTMIAASPLRIDLTSILSEVMPALGTFLRKNQRALKLHSLDLLNKLADNYPLDIFGPPLLQTAISEIQPLISDSDLHVAQYSLVLLTTTARKHPKALIGIHDLFLPAVLQLLRSPLLQGSALICTHDLFQSLVQTNLPGLDYQSLLRKLMEPVTSPSSVAPCTADQLHKQAYHSLAKCVAALTQQCPNEAIPLAAQLLQDLQKPNSIADSQLVFNLLAIGEIGRHFSLDSIPDLPQTIIECFSAGSEDVKGAASHALGAISVGSLETFLPLILNEIEAQPRRQYLLLHSLKEVISSLSVTPNGLSQLLPSVPSIWEQLFKHCECPEEGSRNVVAECLGKLVLVNPEELLPRLQEALKSDSPLMRTVVVSAIKFTISDQPQQIDLLLKQNIGKFLFLLRDPEPSVRRVALVAFNSAVHNKPSLVRELLPTLLPWLYSETKVKNELIREVEMGPFKHTVDDGLDIRKAAFECMYTLLEQGLERVDVMQFLDHVQAGLCDHYDIKMLTYLMTARLAVVCPDAVILRLDQFIQQLRDTCTHKVKQPEEPVPILCE
ncbi:cullin-associated NEDD8-dissociated protein 1 isoform X3 [Musca domestica]|uniref:Cullin-associated NEDD8-dissociated protein 1 isoform X2 n=1 Tax=Musca domestica TaxID=7370 RepID=A0ABM3VJP7_MUSDO|nr:cullin-associated NEDD8-dissociated protein 1 isoform X2 [Musca domestica]XP_058986027.1 cullin-associated NEDD8-dissociated protein 1 isoform X3 [Musca domestica]XP_058986030.1 cullin-associated NEDD8-dissociated protein 1 isoform X3 [Musca domestica]XP_058986034.1 cullin-associated NEDD8-dissociated protein 1 isoform X3 [Musca domestica]